MLIQNKPVRIVPRIKFNARQQQPQQEPVHHPIMVATQDVPAVSKPLSLEELVASGYVKTISCRHDIMKDTYMVSCHIEGNEEHVIEAEGGNVITAVRVLGDKILGKDFRF